MPSKSPRMAKMSVSAKKVAENEPPSFSGMPKLNPKKPSSSYLFFSIEKMSEIKEANPQMSHTQAISECGKQWNSLNDEEKKPYEALAASDKARYQKEMEELETQGYYTNAHGLKCQSGPLKPKIKSQPPTLDQPLSSFTLLSNLTID